MNTSAKHPSNRNHTRQRETLRNLAETESDMELRANAVSGLTVLLESVIVKLENTL